MEGPKAEKPARVVCTVLGRQHHPQPGSSPAVGKASEGWLQCGLCLHLPATFLPPHHLVFLCPRKTNHLQLCLCSRLSLCLECPSHLPLSQSLLILQDNEQPPPSLGGLPQAFRLGPPLLLASRLSITLAHQIMLTLCALSI